MRADWVQGGIDGVFNYAKEVKIDSDLREMESEYNAMMEERKTTQQQYSTPNFNVITLKGNNKQGER